MLSKIQPLADVKIENCLSGGFDIGILTEVLTLHSNIYEHHLINAPDYSAIQRFNISAK